MATTTMSVDEFFYSQAFLMGGQNWRTWDVLSPEVARLYKHRNRYILCPDNLHWNFFQRTKRTLNSLPYVNRVSITRMEIPSEEVLLIPTGLPWQTRSGREYWEFVQLLAERERLTLVAIYGFVNGPNNTLLV